MLVSLKEVLQYAVQKQCAAGAFNVCNFESAKAIVGAAEERQTPVILNYAEIHSPLLCMTDAAFIMLELAKRSLVPVCVHLDHGSSIESCMKAIQLGFTSVMIDASGTDYEANAALTAEVVRLAHSVDVTVEAELGHIFSSDNGVGSESKVIETVESFADIEDVYTNPSMAKDFVNRTGVDALAIAFGTSHGVYTKKPVLDLDRITAIRKAVDIPFVMHGGSGLTKEEFRTAIRNGVRKINYYTYMTLAGGRAVKEAVDQIKLSENLFFHDIPVIATKAMKQDVKETIAIFNME